MFNGFPFDDDDGEADIDTDEAKIDVTTSELFVHIRDELCNGDVGEFNHLLDHIADIIQDPSTVKTVGHVFFTGQGMGKGLLGFFMRRLIGAGHVSIISNMDTYLSRF